MRVVYEAFEGLLYDLIERRDVSTVFLTNNKRKKGRFFGGTWDHIKKFHLGLQG